MVSQLKIIILLTEISFVVGISNQYCTGECVHGLSTSSLNFTQTAQEEQPCLCDVGYTGRYCDEPSFRCLNGGTPLLNGSCRCSSNREGQRCEFEKCRELLHRNGHRNKNVRLLHLKPCICLLGFTGRNCERCADERLCGPILDDYDCVFGRFDTNHFLSTGDRRCECDNNFLGERCDIPRCRFGLLNHDQTFCCCRPGIAGPHCHICLNLEAAALHVRQLIGRAAAVEDLEHASWMPNCHPHGVYNASTEKCTCFDGFDGLNCENKQAGFVSQGSIWKNIMRSLRFLAAFTFILIFLAILCIVVRQRRRSSSSSKDSVICQVNPEVNDEVIEDLEMTEEQLRARIEAMEKRLRTMLQSCEDLQAAERERAEERDDSGLATSPSQTRDEGGGEGTESLFDNDQASPPPSKI